MYTARFLNTLRGVLNKQSINAVSVTQSIAAAPSGDKDCMSTLSTACFD